jgi:protease PrsW
MIRLSLLILFAVVPIVILIYYLKNQNRNYLTWSYIFVPLLIGAGITILYFFLAFFNLLNINLSSSNPFLKAFYEAFFVAALPEEFIKFISIIITCKFFLTIKNELQGIVVGVMGALGFALLENIEYVNQGGIGVAIARAFTSVPGHALMGAQMGYFYYKYLSKQNKISLLLSFVLPVLSHFSYDFMLMASVNLGVYEDKLTSIAIGLLISSFIIFVVLEFGLIMKLIITSVNNLFQVNMLLDNQVTPKDILLNSLSLPSDKSIMHKVRLYIYVYSSILLILLGLPFGIAMLFFLRTIINSYFKPIELNRLLINKIEDDS